MTRPRLRCLALVATLGLGLTLAAAPSSASACQCTYPRPYLYLGAGNQIPADEGGIQWSGPHRWPLQEGRVLLESMDDDGAWVREEFTAREYGPEIVEIVPRHPWRKRFRISIRDFLDEVWDDPRRSGLTEPPGPRPIVVVEEFSRSALTLDGSMPIELRAAAPSVTSTRVLTLAGSCSRMIRAASVRVEATLPPALEPFAGYLLVETYVDGMRWAPHSSLCGEFPAGRNRFFGAEPLGVDVVYSECPGGLDARDRMNEPSYRAPTGLAYLGVAPGEHQVQMVVSSPDGRFRLASESVRVRLDCGGSPATIDDAEPSDVSSEAESSIAPASPASPPAHPAGSRGRCSIGDPERPASPMGLLLCVALLVRRRPRSSGLFTTRRNRPGPRSVEAALIAVTTLLLGCHARPTAPTAGPQSVEDGPPQPAAPTPTSTLRRVEARTPPLLRPEGDAETTALAGGWQVTVQPAEIEAALGDEVAFTIELRPTRSGLGRPWLRAGSRIRLVSGLGDVDDSGRMPEQGGLAHGVLLVAPDEWSPLQSIPVAFEGTTAADALRGAEVPAPRVRTDPAELLAEVDVDADDARCDDAKGLTVEARGGEIVARLSTGRMPLPEPLRAPEPFVLRRIDGRLALIGFVVWDISDIVAAAPRGPIDCGEWPEKDSVWARAWNHSITAAFAAPIGEPVDIIVHYKIDARVERMAVAVVRE